MNSENKTVFYQATNDGEKKDKNLLDSNKNNQVENGMQFEWGWFPGRFLDETFEAFEAFEGLRLEGGAGGGAEGEEAFEASKVRTKALRSLQRLRRHLSEWQVLRFFEAPILDGFFF